MTRVVAATLAIVVTCGSSSPLAYLKLGALVDGRVIDATWKQQPMMFAIKFRRLSDNCHRILTHCQSLPSQMQIQMPYFHLLFRATLKINWRLVNMVKM
jgi:hypothetical protein